MTESADGTVHVPILAHEIIQALTEPLQRGAFSSGWFVDCTLGGGGHTGHLIARLRETGDLGRVRVLAFDRDLEAVERARRRFERELAKGDLVIIHREFAGSRSALEARTTGLPVLGMLADLGFSSDQIDSESRGFGFRSQGAIDMRMNTSEGQPLFQAIRTLTERELEHVIREFGEERFASRIAGSIVRSLREDRSPMTSDRLIQAVVRAVPSSVRHGKIHVATRTFQALRIWINDELGQLESFLEHDILAIAPRGRLAILTFHSLEDRAVKQRLRRKDGGFHPLTKKPVEAGEPEVRSNPRARSAKLRIAEREA